MGTTKISRVRSLLHSLRSLSDSLPTNEERAEMGRALRELSAYLDHVQRELASIPVSEEVSTLIETVNRLDLLLQRAENNPVAARALGLEKRASAPRKRGDFTIDQTRVDELLRRFETMTIDQMREELRSDVFCSLPELRMLATTLGVRNISRMRRDALSEKIVTQVANSRGYRSLSDRQEGEETSL